MWFWHADTDDLASVRGRRRQGKRSKFSKTKQYDPQKRTQRFNEAFDDQRHAFAEYIVLVYR